MAARGQQAATAWRDPLARVGIAARGVLYLVLGVLAIQFATHDVAGSQVNQTGAFEQLGQSGWGKALLLFLIVGLTAMCAFAVIGVIWGDPVEGDDGKERIKFAGRAVVYGLLAVTAVKVATDVWSAGPDQTAANNAGDQSQQRAASTLFDLPAGRLLVVVVGLVLIGIAVYQAWQNTVQAEFMERLAPPPNARRAVETAGRFGYAARSVVFGMSGVFFLVAAAQYDPNKSRGISGSLQEMAEHGWGRAVLWLTAVGLVAFGVYCLAEARYRRKIS